MFIVVSSSTALLVLAGHQQGCVVCLQVEVRVLNVAPNCPAAAVLQQHIAAAHQLSVDPPSQSNDSSSHSSSGAAVLTPSMIPSIPAAFELKTQSVCLDGVDLPTLLPAAAALPPAVQLLPGLAEDVTAARDEAAAAALMGDVQRQSKCAVYCHVHNVM